MRRFSAGVWVAALLFALAAPTTGLAADPKNALRCEIKGTAGPDVLVGTPGRDVICGRRGDDVIRARRGNDVVFAGAGEDRAFGQAGADRLHGELKGDLLVGGLGADSLYGEGGHDRLRGGSGSDILLGDLGNDGMSAGGDEGDHAIGGPGVNTGDTLVGGSRPNCLSTADEMCIIPYLHLDAALCFPSNSFTQSGSCTGSSRSSMANFISVNKVQNGIFAGFVWGRDSQGVVITYQVFQFGIPSAALLGEGPANPGSPVFKVDDGFALEWASPSTHFHTRNIPGLRPSDEGGPLYLNFESGRTGADIYIWGFMSRK